MESATPDLGDVSFSYLTKAGNFAVSLSESAAAISPGQEVLVPVERTKPEEGEISVFGAEKYFNMKLEGDQKNLATYTDTKLNKTVYEKENLADLHRRRPKPRIGTPSVSSEVSSNSQAALLPRNSSQTRHKKGNERWFFGGFACNGSCSDEKSVYVDKNISHHGTTTHRGKDSRKETTKIGHNPMMLEGRKVSQPRLHDPSFEKTSGPPNREEYYVLPTVNSGVQNMINVKKEEQLQKKIIDEEPRMSLEVFGSHSMRREDIAKNLERKLSVLTWDAIPTQAGIPSTSETSCCHVYEEIASDASSDLFEIESAQPMYTKQTSNGMSVCMTPPSQYAPSEKSIEWSVATASAVADLSERKKSSSGGTKLPGLVSTPRRGKPSSLLGCKSQKAVEVAESTYKKNDTAKSHLQQHPRLDTSKVKDFDFL